MASKGGAIAGVAPNDLQLFELSRRRGAQLQLHPSERPPSGAFNECRVRTTGSPQPPKPGIKPIKIVSPVDLNTQWFMVVISQHHRLVGPPQVRAADE
jgi:hypothetical protein